MQCGKFTEYIDGEGLLHDWKQVNWELIVEQNIMPIGEKFFLQPYGEGADFYGDSSRIIRPEAVPTHAVSCCSKNGAVEQLTGKSISFPIDGFEIDCFVTIRKKWYFEEPPFDCVLVLDNENEFVFLIEDVTFGLKKITP
jgi:hypothetical protein